MPLSYYPRVGGLGVCDFNQHALPPETKKPRGRYGAKVDNERVSEEQLALLQAALMRGLGLRMSPWRVCSGPSFFSENSQNPGPAARVPLVHLLHDAGAYLLKSMTMERQWASAGAIWATGTRSLRPWAKLSSAFWNRPDTP